MQSLLNTLQLAKNAAQDLRPAALRAHLDEAIVLATDLKENERVARSDHDVTRAERTIEQQEHFDQITRLELQLASARVGQRLAFELGYKAHERGLNVQAALAEFDAMKTAAADEEAAAQAAAAERRAGWDPKP